jgi:hypothetical protein
MKATRLPKDPAPLFSFGHYTVSDDQWTHGYLSQGVRRILADPEFAQSLAITKDQLKQLASLPPAPGPRWPKESRDRLTDLYTKWDTAPAPQKPAAANQLTQALRDDAKSKHTADQDAISKRLTQIRATLTPQQLEKLNPIPHWDLPATQPATRPKRPDFFDFSLDPDQTLH